MADAFLGKGAQRCVQEHRLLLDCLWVDLGSSNHLRCNPASFLNLSVILLTLKVGAG